MEKKHGTPVDFTKRYGNGYKVQRINVSVISWTFDLVFYHHFNIFLQSPLEGRFFHPCMCCASPGDIRAPEAMYRWNCECTFSLTTYQSCKQIIKLEFKKPGQYH
ncbi:hypothetical protein FKM82_011832 [Ascaphus truei]